MVQYIHELSCPEILGFHSLPGDSNEKDVFLTWTVGETARHCLSVRTHAVVTVVFRGRILTSAHALSFPRSTFSGTETPHVPCSPVSLHCNKQTNKQTNKIYK